MTPSISELRRTAEEAARCGGKLLAERFMGKRTIGYKAGIDLVTDADRVSEEAIIAFLQGRYPEHAILAEETGARKGSGLRWIIDPLDGTTNYAHRVPHFCVSIAVDGPEGMLAGAIYDPMREEMFSAGRGEGATLNGRKLQTSDATEISQALLGTGFPYDVRERPEAPVGLFKHFVEKAQGMRRMGSAALDLAYVACGRFEAFFEFKLKTWDIAAGTLLVEEAGGVVTRIDGAPLDLVRGDVLASAHGLAKTMQRESKRFLDSIRWTPE